ncbi:MAG: hypothetical protein JOZ22_24850 [Acidobacteriia bacterium]|nr:hypothetical protein [Terriglobia bacterium]
MSVCCLGPDLVARLEGCTQADELLKSSFHITVAQDSALESDSLPDISGRYVRSGGEVHFIPSFPFENDIQYRAIFDLRPLGYPLTEPLTLEFLIPSEPQASEIAEVTQIFPSGDVLPENLLRFYVCFSSSMQRGRALEEIALLDSDGRPVSDALYRPPVELWDRSMRRLTVLLDPGRLKRWVGPNVELGPPLKAGQRYTLEIGPGMKDLHGHPLGKPFRKHFLAGDPTRGPIAVEEWKVVPPVAGSRKPLILTFPGPLDRALLLQTILVESADGPRIEGQVIVDEGEKRWSFIPDSPWAAGRFHIRIEAGLEDVCGNNMMGAFDRPLRKDVRPTTHTGNSSLVFQVA